MKYIRKNKKKLLVYMCITVLIPIVIQRISVMSVFSGSSNDWVGFWGSYIGAIVGAFVALYVLVKTLDDNKKNQKRAEVIDFCNCIAEKSSRFAQRYEEALYEAHTYLTVHELKTSQSEQEFSMYKQFIATHHSAKAMLYEIETYLSIRKDLHMFITPKFEKTLKAAEMTYRKFKGFESKVAKAEKVADVDDKDLIKVAEEFLELLNQYEKELLDEMAQENKGYMKTLKEIYQDAKGKNRLEQREALVTYYSEVIKNEIKDSKAKLLVYKEECQNRIDLNIPMFWMSTLSTVLTILSIMIAMIAWKFTAEETPAIAIMIGGLIIILFVDVIYYQIVISGKKKYSLIAMVLENIEVEMNEKSLFKNESLQERRIKL